MLADESMIAIVWRRLVRLARAIGGVPDYETYLAHCHAHHHGQEPLDRAAFHREREAARYSRGRSRCC